ncbi:MAG: hypothetical protein HXK14_01550 [Actinomyces sp.]|nr:hypothetical protein [Actinomyces sp.]
MAGKAIGGSATSVDLRPGAEALIQLPDATGDASELSAKFSKDETAIKHTQVVQNKSSAPEEWTGAAADAASGEIQKLGTKTEQLAEPFGGASGALNEWATTLGSLRDQIKTLQGDWDSAITQYHKDVADAGPDPSKQTFISTPGNPPNNDDAIAAYREAIKKARITLHSAQEEFKTTYTGYLTQCSEAAQSAANKINAARREVVSDEAGAGGRSVVGVNLFGSDTPLLAGAEQWEDAQVQAEQMAEVLKKQPMTTQDIMTFNEKWGDLLENPFYAYALKQRVSTDEIYAAVLNAGMLASDDANHPSYTFNKNLGTALALATGGANLSDSNRENQKIFDSVSSGLVGENGLRIDQTTLRTLDELKNTGRERFAPPGHDNAAPEFTMDGYDIAGQIMGLAGRENTSLTLGPGFYADPRFDPILGEKVHVKSVFQDMVAWDYEVGAGSRAIDKAGSLWQTRLIPPEYGNRDYQGYLDPLQNIFTLSDTPDYLHGNSDEVLQQYEDKRLAALRYVLASDGPKDAGGIEVYPPSDSKKMNMTRYLTGWRGLAANGGLAYIDGGDAFGDMVNDASARTAKPLSPSDPGYKEWQADDQLRAQVAENFLVGYGDGLDQNADTTSTGEDVFGNSNPKLRSWLGHVVAQRVDDLAYMSDKANWGGLDTGHSINPQSGYSMMNLSGTQVRHLYSKTGFLADLTHDRAAYQDLSDAAWMGYSTEVRDSVRADYGSDGTDWINKFNLNTRGWDILINGIDTAPNDAGTALTEAEQRTNAEHRAAIDFALSVVPVDKIPVVGPGLSVAKTFAEGIWKDSLYEKYLPTEFSAEDLLRRADAEFKVDAETGEKLNEAVESAFLSRSEWPNTAGKTEEELLAEFAKQYPGDVRQDGSVPPFGQMTSEERGHLRTFLSSKTISSFDALTGANQTNATAANTFVENCRK